MFPKFLTTNSLFHDDEEAKKEREQIYVPLALVERKKTDKRQQEYSPDRGSELYDPQYEEKQRFEHDAFLEQVLQQGRGKTHGTRIALIGEPGAGKTTLLQKIADWVEEKNLGLPLWVSLADLATGGSLQDFDTYLLERWLSKAVSEEGTQGDFRRQFELQRVWLLLDGVDEVAASGVETLGSIAKQLVGWVGKARVVLTCRLNVWQGDVNALSDFETFRLLDFDYPQQVHQFIDNWFAAETAKGERLQAELAKPERSRVRDLVQTPLRLALLCRTWQWHQGDLPDTWAGLYAQFVDRFYHWKSNRFSISKQRQRELNRGLGKLAQADLDSGGGRFRLREGFVSEKLGDGDDESSLFYLALKLGWLNRVGVAAESPEEKVYAFYHPTFEEYFAALAVKEDWRFFLNHVPENVASGTYRVFESQWKQVILLWLGRSDVDEVRKEEFIGALVDFEDETGRDFYGLRTLFLAAAGIAEFKGCSRADEIVAQVVKVGFCFFSEEEEQRWLMWPNEVERAARVALGETERGRAVDALVELIRKTQDEGILQLALWRLAEIGQGNDTAINALFELISTSESQDTRWQATRSLGKIGQGNDRIINFLAKLIDSDRPQYFRRLAAFSLAEMGQDNTLVQLVANTHSENTRRLAAESLEEICQGNRTAINALVELAGNSQSEHIRRQAVESLGKIGQGSDAAIDVLVRLIKNTGSEDTRRQAVESLGRIGQGNGTAIAALVEFIKNTCTELFFLPDYNLKQAIESLGRIGQDNNTVIATLIELIDNIQSVHIRQWAAKSLGRIGQGNKTAIATLVKLIHIYESEGIRMWVAKSLGEIDPGNETAIATLIELINNSQSEHICTQAAEILAEIGRNNDTAITALVDLIRTYEPEDTRWEVIENLWEIGQGNETAINTLVELIRTSESEDIHCWAAHGLEKIGQGNETAIAALAELTTQSTDTRCEAARSLGFIGQGNETAINALVELISTSQHEDTQHTTVILGFISVCNDFLQEAAKSLKKIGQGNQIAIATLVELIANTQSEETRIQAIEILGEIATEPQIPKVVSPLKNFLSDETYKNDRYLFNECYKVIWKCAQILPYKKFHQAWHDRPPTLEQQLTNIHTSWQHLPLLCVDAEILETETTEEAIAQTLCELVYTAALPDADYPDANNAPQLRRHLRALAKQQGRSRLLILIHNCQPQPEIQQFCRKLANIADIAWITDTPLEPPLKIIAPSETDLTRAIASWLQELGDG